MLNTRVFDYVGRLSYSLYIWQQLFFDQELGSLSRWPFNLVSICIVANISFYFIEKPFLKLKKYITTSARFSAAIQPI
jgi:peptidoglycan/LPS O-acetylase OafA/YrhL